MTTIRASRLPLLKLCPASAAPGLTIESACTEAADMGTAVHALVTGWITGGLSSADTDAEAARHGLDPEELGTQARIAFAAWVKAAEHFPAPQCEVPLSWTDEANGITLTGHADILCVVDL